LNKKKRGIADMNQSRVKGVILWIVQILLAAAYVLAASGKLMSRPQWIERFRNWGFPDKFYLVIGALELVGAIGLLIPRTAGYAAAGLILLMIGAALTNLIHGDGLQVLRPLIFMLFLTLVVYLRRPWAAKQSS
jgi:putative oxidoreductase